MPTTQTTTAGARTQTIKIQIGQFDGLYHAMDTKAPSDYDGFGTFTICEIDGTRTVLIRDEHFLWQTQRYSSGLNCFAVPTMHDIIAIEDALCDRLRGTSELS